MTGPRLALFALLTVAVTARADAPAPLTEANVIGGTMTIEYADAPSSAPAATQPTTGPAVDRYVFTLTVAKTTEYSGRITRDAGGVVTFDLNIAVLSPKDLVRKKTVGRWTGATSRPAGDGSEDVGNTGNGPRIAIDALDGTGKPQRFSEPFAGKLSVKPAGPVTYARTIGGKTALWTAAAVRRVRLTGVQLAMGPVPIYARTAVGGRVDFDPRGDAFAENVTFDSTADAKPVHDTVTGSIRRTDADDYATTGHGRYSVDLRFNDTAVKPAKADRGQDAAFFAADPAVAGLGGSVDFVDTFVPGTPRVERRKLTFKLGANRLTKPQIVNAFKLALLCLGPATER